MFCCLECIFFYSRVGDGHSLYQASQESLLEYSYLLQCFVVKNVFLLFKGWRWAFFISGIPGILVGILIFITVFCFLECIFFCSRVGDGHSLYLASQESLLEYSYLLNCVLLSRMYFLLFKGWRWAFFISGILGILVGILIFITVFCCLECISSVQGLEMGILNIRHPRNPCWNTHIYYCVLLSRMYFLLFKGWRWAFFISGIPGILVGILIFITVFCCLECMFLLFKGWRWEFFISGIPGILVGILIFITVF